MIYWNRSWTPICAAEFAEESRGADMFCQKLQFLSGSADVDFDVANEKDAFMIGRCKDGDKWPYCDGGVGGCNFRTIGHRCYKSVPKIPYLPYTDCIRTKRPKLFVMCHGPKVIRNIFSCAGNIELPYKKYFNPIYIFY